MSCPCRCLCFLGYKITCTTQIEKIKTDVVKKKKRKKFYKLLMGKELPLGSCHRR